MGRIWFMSDTHFGHESVLRLNDRPFADIADMGDGLVDNINRRVAAGDGMYVLGYFSFKIIVKEARRVRRRIRCRKVYLVSGNHDKDWTAKAVAGTFIVERDVLRLKTDAQLVLSHYPLADWRGKSHGTIHLHGHIHSVGPAYNDLQRAQGVYRMDAGAGRRDACRGQEMVAIASVEVLRDILRAYDLRVAEYIKRGLAQSDKGSYISREESRAIRRGGAGAA